MITIALQMLLLATPGALLVLTGLILLRVNR